MNEIYGLKRGIFGETFIPIDSPFFGESTHHKLNLIGCKILCEKWILRNEPVNEDNQDKVQLSKENAPSKQIVIYQPCTPIDSSRYDESNGYQTHPTALPGSP